MTADTRPRLELHLLPTPATPGIARRRLAEEFGAELDTDELQDAQLLISELVTNAVIHGSGPIELSALLDDNRLTVDVTDRGGGFERPIRERDPGAVGGHGLRLVGSLASRWGIHHGSSHVWFELECHPHRLGPADESLA
jgi:anti-sigma regulatory factor (Ser/Thr protein kinase)